MNPAIVVMVAVVLSVLAIILVFRFGKAFFKVITALSFIAAIVIVIIGAIVYNDSINFQEEFQKSQNVFVLESGNVVLAGVEIMVVSEEQGGAGLFRRVIAEKSSQGLKAYLGRVSAEVVENKTGTIMDFLNSTTIAGFQKGLEEGDISQIKGNNYKLVLVKLSLFDELPAESFTFGEEEISKELMKEMLVSETPISILAEKIAEDEDLFKEGVEDDIRSQVGSDQMLKGYLFALVLQDLFTGDPGDVSSLLSYLKREEIIIYPETIMFKTLKIIPEPLIEVVSQKIAGER